MSGSEPERTEVLAELEQRAQVVLEAAAEARPVVGADQLDDHLARRGVVK